MQHICVILCILILSLGQISKAVKVYEFGPRLEKSSKVVITNDAPAPEAFTLCLDFYSRLEKNRRLLVTKNAEDLHIEIDDYSSVIYVRIAGIWYLAIPESPPYIDTLTWDTVCISFDSNTQAIIVVFRGLILVDEETIYPNRTFSQDFLKYLSIGERDSYYHFSGEITRLNIWSKVVDKELLVNISNCDDSNLQGLPDVLNWETVEAKIEGGVIERELADFPCKDSLKETQEVLMPEPAISMFDAVKTCNLLQGNLFFPPNKEDLFPFLEKIRSQLPNSRCQSYIWSNYYKNTNAGNNWTIYESEITYRYPPFKYPAWIEWALGQPNGKHLQNCAGISLQENKYLDDLSCYDKEYCYVCR